MEEEKIPGINFPINCNEWGDIVKLHGNYYKTGWVKLTKEEVERYKETGAINDEYYKTIFSKEYRKKMFKEDL